MHTTASVNVTILEITIFKTFFLEFCGLKCSRWSWIGAMSRWHQTFNSGSVLFCIYYCCYYYLFSLWTSINTLIFKRFPWRVQWTYIRIITVLRRPLAQLGHRTGVMRFSKWFIYWVIRFPSFTTLDSVSQCNAVGCVDVFFSGVSPLLCPCWDSTGTRQLFQPGRRTTSHFLSPLAPPVVVYLTHFKLMLRVMNTQCRSVTSRYWKLRLSWKNGT